MFRRSWHGNSSYTTQERTVPPRGLFRLAQPRLETIDSLRREFYMHSMPKVRIICIVRSSRMNLLTMFDVKPSIEYPSLRTLF